MNIASAPVPSRCLEVALSIRRGASLACCRCSAARSGCGRSLNHPPPNCLPSIRRSSSARPGSGELLVIHTYAGNVDPEARGDRRGTSRGSCRVRRYCARPMRARSVLLERKVTTLRASIGTGLPVLGLRPARGPFSRRRNAPKLDRLMFSPLSSVLLRMSKNASVSSCASCRFIPIRVQSAAAMSDLVTVSLMQRCVARRVDSPAVSA